MDTSEAMGMTKHPTVLRLLYGLLIAGILLCTGMLLGMLLRAPHSFCLANVQFVKGAIFHAPI